VQIEDYAQAGLRTLVLGFKELQSTEYLVFKAKFDVAAAAMENRQREKEACYVDIERGFTLMGATAIEDRLQVCAAASIFFVVAIAVAAVAAVAAAAAAAVAAAAVAAVAAAAAAAVVVVVVVVVRLSRSLVSSTQLLHR
jgi:hypothetical protein